MSWSAVREALALADAEEAEGQPVAFDDSTCLLVRVAELTEVFSIPTDGLRVAFGVVGRRPFEPRRVALEPAVLEESIETVLGKVRGSEAFDVYEIELRPRGDGAALAGALATALGGAGRLVVRIESNAENAGEFSIPVVLLLGRIRAEPPAIDLGRVAFFGDTRVEAGGPTLVLEAGGRRRELLAGKDAEVGLPPGRHAIEVDGRRRTVVGPPLERTIRLVNDGQRPVRLTWDPDPDQAVHVVPSVVEVAPGRAAPVRVRFLTGRAVQLGPWVGAVAFDVHGVGESGAAPGRIEVPVAVDLVCRRVVLSVETDAIDLGIRALGEGIRFIVPYRLVGKGKVRLGVAFEAAAPTDGLFELEKDYAVLKNPMAQVTPGFLAVRVDPTAYFDRGLDRFRIVLSTDAHLLDRRRHEIDVRLVVRGLALADRSVAFDAHPGLCYQIPLAVRAETAPGNVDYRVVEIEGGRRDLMERLHVSEWHHLDAVEPGNVRREPAEHPGALGFEVHPAVGYLLLDLTGLDPTGSDRAPGERLDWRVVLEEVATGYRQDLRLVVDLRNSNEILGDEILRRVDGTPPSFSLEFRVANPTDRPFRVVRVVVEAVRFPGLERIETSPGVRIRPGRSKRFSLGLAVQGGGLSGALTGILVRQPELRLSVATDLPGEAVFERRIRFRRR